MTLATLVALASCGSNDAESPSCVAVPAGCQPLYEPTYEALFTRTFNPSCGVAGSSCHQAGGAGTKTGLTFDNPARTYAALTDASRSWKLVEPGNPSCSKIVYKITAHEMSVVMPPGRPLVAAEQCAIETWIAKGAPQ